jgi:hypothetical protein
MDIIEVNGKKYIKKKPISNLFRPIIAEQAKPIDIITPIKPIFVCNGQCGICKDKKCFII